MAQMTDIQPRQRDLRNVKLLMGLAIGFALAAAAAGLILVVTTPESGSTTEATLGVIAAVSGLATAGFAIGAAIYAQVKNLWQYAPMWIRVAAWGLIAFAIVTSLWRSIA